VLPETFACIQTFLEHERIAAEVILVDDGSADNTPAVVRQCWEMFENFLMLRNTANRGKGASVRRGVLASSGCSVLVTDADLPARPEDISRLLAALEDGAMIAIGSRHTTLRESSASEARLLASNLYRGLVRAILQLPILDTQCGFKAFRRKPVVPIFEGLRLEGYSVDAEFLYAAWQQGLPIREVELTVIERRPTARHGILLRSPQMLMDLFRIRSGNGRNGGKPPNMTANLAKFLLDIPDAPPSVSRTPLKVTASYPSAARD
jgi:dolichyl-phosphate beta-glucosyltransferase